MASTGGYCDLLYQQQEAQKGLEDQIAATKDSISGFTNEYEKTLEYIDNTEQIYKAKSAVDDLGTAADGAGTEISAMSQEAIEAFNKNHEDDYIVVGIDNADIYRDSELTLNMKLTDFVELAQVEFAHCYEDGKEMYFEYFSNFIKETLLPFIKSKYNLKEEKLTVVGSSSGGEASFYFGLQNMDIVERIFCFSSATATIKPKVFLNTLKKLKIKKNRKLLPELFIFQGGTGELESLLAMGNEYLVPLLKHYGYEENKISYLYQKDSDHNEDSWKYAFNYFISLIDDNK